jgi:hypothetical protein
MTNVKYEHAMIIIHWGERGKDSSNCTFLLKSLLDESFCLDCAFALDLFCVLSGLFAVFFEPFGWTFAVCDGNFVLEERRFLHVLSIDYAVVVVKEFVNIEYIDYIEKNLLAQERSNPFG